MSGGPLVSAGVVLLTSIGWDEETATEQVLEIRELDLTRYVTRGPLHRHLDEMMAHPHVTRVTITASAAE